MNTCRNIPIIQFNGEITYYAFINAWCQSTTHTKLRKLEVSLLPLKLAFVKTSIYSLRDEEKKNIRAVLLIFSSGRRKFTLLHQDFVLKRLKKSKLLKIKFVHILKIVPY